MGRGTRESKYQQRKVETNNDTIVLHARESALYPDRPKLSDHTKFIFS
jgi:hypothetical protein